MTEPPAEMSSVMPLLRVPPFLLAAIALMPLLHGAPARSAPSEPDRPQKAPHSPVTLDDLYTRLKDADDPAEAKGIAALIERRLARSGSATVDLLTERARLAMSMPA